MPGSPSSGSRCSSIAEHPEVEPQAHEPVERPLQRVAPVDRAAAGLGLGQLPVAEEEGGHEQRRDEQVQQHPLRGQQPGEHAPDSNRPARPAGDPVTPPARAVRWPAPPAQPDGDPPGRCLRWSAAERSRIVSPHTVIGGDRRLPGTGATDPPGGPSGRTGRRTRRQRAVARGSRLARLAALGLLGVLTLTGCAMRTTSSGASAGPRASPSRPTEMRELWTGSVIAALVVGIAVWGLILWSVVRHRKRGDELPKQTAYNLPLEIVYTIVPFVIIAVLFFYTVVVQNKVQERSDRPRRDGRRQRLQVELAVRLPGHRGRRTASRSTRSATATRSRSWSCPTDRTSASSSPRPTSSTRSGCRSSSSSSTSSRATRTAGTTSSR